MSAVKTCIIFNPTARGEKAREFRAFLESIGDRAAVKPTGAPGAATVLAKAAVEDGFENIVAAGGDGTLNEVLNGIGEADDGFAKTRLGALPLGTINVFAKELGLPARPAAAWEVIAADRERLVDLPFVDYTADGEKRRRYFAQLAGAGLDAEAVSLVDRESKRRYRQLAYVFAGLRALRKPQVKIEVRSNAHSATGELVLIGNGRFYGGRLPVFPEASLVDGKLDVCVFTRVGIFMLLRCAFWLCLGRLPTSSSICRFQADRIRLSSAAEAKFEVEGDLGGVLPVEIGVRPQTLRVSCP